ncbi:hypothetical protein BIY24_07350 [Halobacteriovorax marinus]|uniref:hypothetical protein n=1 Tax=Halobacteriovorax marinus TaxID=97084 RepID=UPI000BC33F55|nr:hypothetical protein [Halobacteriovorax marinus]ATH07768.1 hypothetical protein BIY24_07350 [Halobacteriovorax marinus]
MKILLVSIILFNLSSYSLAQIEQSTILANRFLIENIFIEIFGKKVRKYTQKYIIPNINVFGGPCDIYEQVRKKDEGVYKLNSSCFENKSNHKASFNTKPNVLRSGYILKMCKSILSDSIIMEDYYKKHNIKKWSNYSSKKLFLIHRDFYPLKKVSKEQEEAIRKLFYQKSHLRWDSIILSYCLSPQWRIL